MTCWHINWDCLLELECQDLVFPLSFKLTCPLLVKKVPIFTKEKKKYLSWASGKGHSVQCTKHRCWWLLTEEWVSQAEQRKYWNYLLLSYDINTSQEERKRKKRGWAMKPQLNLTCALERAAGLPVMRTQFSSSGLGCGVQNHWCDTPELIALLSFFRPV